MIRGDMDDAIKIVGAQAVTVIGTSPEHFKTPTGDFDPILKKKKQIAKICWPLQDPSYVTFRNQIRKEETADAKARYVDFWDILVPHYEWHIGEYRGTSAGMDCLHWCLNDFAWREVLQAFRKSIF